MLPAASLVAAGIRLKRAIDSVPDKLTPLSRCVTAEDEFFATRFDADYSTGSSSDEAMRDDSAGDEKSSSAAATGKPKGRRLSHTQCEDAAALKKMREQCERAARTGRIIENDSSTLRLKVTRPGCEYDAPLVSITEATLKQWHQHGQPSAYGNTATLATVVDATVRSAREAPSDQFTVDEETRRMVERLWAEHFWPSAVRAEPYKLNVYGPGDHFAAHKDTPASGLVGTLLLGLGDGSNGRFVFPNDEAQDWWSSRLHGWCAFFPSVVHRVTRISEGFRATLAFKLYSTETTPLQATSAQLADITRSLSTIAKPFGLLLQH